MKSVDRRDRYHVSDLVETIGKRTCRGQPR